MCTVVADMYRYNNVYTQPTSETGNLKIGVLCIE